MTNNTKLEDKLEGADNFWARKYRVLIILEEHDLENYVKEEIEDPKGDEVKTKHKKNLVKAKRSIVNSIKNPTQGCEDAYVRKHSILLLPGQGITRIH